MNTAVQKIRSLAANSRKLFGLLILSALLAPLTWSLPAHAISFEDAAKAGTAKISDLDGMGGFLAKATSKALGNVTLTNIKADGKGLTGDVSLRGKPWTLVINVGDGEKKTFVGFGPKTGFTFGDLIGNNPMSKLFDTMKLTRPVLFIAVADVSMGSGDLPANIKTFLGPLYEKPNDFTLDITQGLTLISALDMSKAAVIDGAIKFLGGKSSKVQLKGEMDIAVIDSMIHVLGAPKGPNLKLSAALPTFRPTIGGLITMPADIQLTLRANYFKTGKWLGFDGKTKFKIGSQLVDAKLAQTFHLPKSPTEPAYSKTKISMFDDKPFKNAFGVKWLEIKGYNMLFKLKSDGALYIEFGGSTIFGEKSIHLAGGFGLDLKNLGMPLPSLLDFSVDAGPDKVGSISLRDMASVYNEMAKSTGNPALVPLNKVPDVAIAGTGVGPKNAPRIVLRFEKHGDDGFEIQGKLRILGADVATIDKAFLKMNSGIEIRARTAKIKAGPIQLPNSDVEIVILIDRETGKIPTPRVLIHTQALSLFGSNVEMDTKLYIDKAILAADISASKLFEFKFRSFAGFTSPLKTLPDLASADFRLLASLKSDPAAWLRDLGNGAVKAELDKLTPGFDVALKALDTAKAEVNKLNREIRRQRDKVKRERQSAQNALTGAQNNVNKLQKDIDFFEDRRVYFRSQIKPCNQTWTGCVLYSLRRTGCHVRVPVVGCTVPEMSSYCARRATIPDYPARGLCDIKNLEWRSQEIWADGKKHGVIGIKVPADRTLQALKDGLSKIPVDLDPRVAGPLGALELAKLALDAAKEAVKGVLKFKQILADSVKILNKAPDWFALENGSIKGSLAQGKSGKPVILDLTFRIDGKRFKNRMSFWLNNAAANGAQYTLLGLGIVVKEVVKRAKQLKFIPHGLLDQVENLYFNLKTKADKELNKAIVDNGNIATDPKDAPFRLSRSLELDHKVRGVKRLVAQNRLIALRAKFGKLLSKLRLEQLEKLTKGNKWKKMPSAALDIGAGANGSVWASDTKGIWSWTGSNWKKMPGTATRIDVGPQGRAWTVGRGNALWRWNGKGWDRLPGKGVDIGVGADGTAWMAAGKEGIYRWNGAGWDKMPGTATRIDVDPKGRAWTIGQGNAIWRWNLVKNNWDRIPTHAIDIGIGADGTVVAIGRDNRSYVWDGSKWNVLTGTNAVSITVDRNGDPWVITKVKNIWAWDKAGKAPAARITSKPWKPEGSKWGKPLASKEGDIVTVTGSVKGGDYITPVMVLPKGSRPSKRLIFSLNNHAKPVRMDVFPDGRVLWIAGGRDRGWLSLSGIKFATKKGKPIALKNGWKYEGGEWAPPTAFKSGDMVTVTGSIARGKFGLLGTLPGGMRPPRRTIFNVSNHAKSARLDVFPNGEIWWKAGGKDHGWISLSGITFSTKKGSTLTLAKGWRNLGASWAPPSVTRLGDMVTITGVIKGGKWGHLATLPAGFRPPAQLVFSANTQATSARVDVKENGEINWVAGGKGVGWISLSGISFQTDDPISPHYDQVAYLVRHGNLQNTYVKGTTIDWGALAKHWENHGIKKKLNANPLGKCGNSGGLKELKGKIFDPCFYLNSGKNRDLKKAFGKDNLQAATEHWFSHGIREGRQSNANNATFKGHQIFTLKVKSSGRCFDQSGSDKAAAQAHSWDCRPRNLNQRFQVVYKDGVWFNLINQRNKMCVDVGNASKANGGQVIQWKCHQGRNQHWRKVDRGGGWISFVNRNSGRCLNLAYGKKPNGSKFDQFDCGATNSTQLFKLETGGKSSFKEAQIVTLQVKSSGRCFDQSGSDEKGAQAHSWDCKKHKNQQFQVLYKSGEWFQLVNQRNKLCVGVRDNSKKNGGKVAQLSCDQFPNRHWRQTDRGDGWFLIQNRNSGRCLNLAYGKKPNGSKFDQYECGNKNPTQMFKIVNK